MSGEVIDAVKSETDLFDVKVEIEEEGLDEQIDKKLDRFWQQFLRCFRN